MRPLVTFFTLALTASCAGSQASSALDTERPARVGTVERTPAQSTAPVASTAPGAPNTDADDEGAEKSDQEPDLAELGSLIGNDVGEAFGTGGLGLSGIGINDGTSGGIGLGTAGGQGWGTGAAGSSAATPDSRGTVDAGGATVTGQLDREIIRRIIVQHRPRIRHCYQRELARNPKLEGKLTVRFVIDPNGNVPQVNSTAADISNPALVDCVLATFRAMRFPKPRSGIVVVNYPLVFRVDNAASSGADAGAH